MPQKKTGKFHQFSKPRMLRKNVRRITNTIASILARKDARIFTVTFSENCLLPEKIKSADNHLIIFFSRRMEGIVYILTSCANNYRRTEYYRIPAISCRDSHGGWKPWSCRNQVKQQHIQHAKQTREAGRQKQKS